MLKSSHIQIAAQYVGDLNNLQITAMPNTVLASLTREAMPPLNIKTDSTGIVTEPLSLYQLIENITSGTAGTPSQHDIEFGSYVDDLSSIVNNHISFAKNTAKPLVLELAEQINLYNASNKNKSASETMRINIKQIPPLLNNELFLQGLEYAKGRKPIPPINTLNLAAKDKKELLELMLTGSSNTNESISSWILSKEDDFLPSIWRSFFFYNNSINVLSYDKISVMNPIDQANYLVALYLISSGLIAKVDNNANIPLNTYNAYLNDIIDYCAKSLVSCIVRIATLDRTNTLVIGTGQNSVDVYDKVYNKFLAEGNSQEILFGNIVNRSTYFTIKEIVENKEMLLATWNSYCSFYKTNQINDRYAYFASEVERAFFEQLKHTSELENEYIKTNSTYFETVKKLFDVEIRKVNISEMDNVYEIALALIGKCRFFYTSAFDILNNINEAGKINPNIDVREAALISAIYYISDYLADQIAIVK